MFKRACSLIVLAVFLLTTIIGPNASYAQGVFLPEPGTMVQVSPAFVPVMMRGVTLHADNPMLFEFVMDMGNSGLMPGTADDAGIKAESQRIIEYFLASLTIPEKDQWVNLSPYEKDRMLTDELGKTGLGRDMLAQDYLLKQVTASMIYPDKEMGQEFWKRVYDRAQAEYGTTDIPMDTFNKVWIVADRAAVYTHKDPVKAGQITAVVTDAHLKVMLESDYVAMSHQKDMAESQAPARGVAASHSGAVSADAVHAGTPAQEMAKQIVREIVIPEIEKEVNTGKNFANLRQIYQTVILATWYKRNLKDALLTQVYADHGKTGGVEGAWVANKGADTDPEQIWNQYVEAYKKGVFDLIKEDVNQGTGEILPRKYFSGGAIVVPAQVLDAAMKDVKPGVGPLVVVTTDARVRRLPADVRVPAQPTRAVRLAIGQQEKLYDQQRLSETLLLILRYMTNFKLGNQKEEPARRVVLKDGRTALLLGLTAPLRLQGGDYYQDVIQMLKEQLATLPQYRGRLADTMVEAPNPFLSGAETVREGEGYGKEYLAVLGFAQESTAQELDQLENDARVILKRMKSDSDAAMAWDDVKGNPAGWVNRVVVEKVVSAVDDKDDKYRDYDYRSVDGLKPEVAFVMALAWAKMEKEKMGKAGITKKRVLIARDARKIEPEIVDAQIAAMRYAGFDVVYIAGKKANCVTSLSWAMQQVQPVMSSFNTASHVARPKEVKVRGNKVTQQVELGGVANSLTTDEIKTGSRAIVADMIKNPDQITALKAPQEGSLEVIDIDENVVKFNTAVGLLAAENGSLYQFGEGIRNSTDPLSVVTDYLAKNQGREKPLSKLKVVVKGGHTPSGPLTTSTFQNLGATVVNLQGDLDQQEVEGMHDVDPSIDANIQDLKAEIVRTGAHFGIAYDLDGDRGLILVPERNAAGEVIKWHALSPDNLLGMLLPELISSWGYGQSGKKIGVIKDVLGTNGVFDVAKKLNVLDVQTDAGYVFLKAAKAELEKQGYVFPVYGEKSGHTWLHVAGEIENPLAVAVLFSVIAARKMSETSANPVLDVYNTYVVPYTSSPRFQPPFHPAFLAELGEMPQNKTGWKFDPAKPGVAIPQSIIGLGRSVGIQRIKESFPIGKVFKTAVGDLRVSKVDDGKGRYADVVFEKDGVFIGHVVFRASSNDPSFVMTYEAPILNTDRVLAERYRRSVSGIVLKFLSERQIGLFARADIQRVMPHLAPAKVDETVQKGNLAPVEADLTAFLDENQNLTSSEVDSSDKAMLRGGIDFNTTDALTTSGDTVDLKFDPAMLEKFKQGDFTGIAPVITTITPIQGWSPILGSESAGERPTVNG